MDGQIRCEYVSYQRKTFKFATRVSKVQKNTKRQFLYSGKTNEFWQKICGSYKNKRLNHNRRVEADVSIYVM